MNLLMLAAAVLLPAQDADRQAVALWLFDETACGGVEHEGGVHDRFFRLTQRLEGFVSLDAGPDGGTAVTNPLVFKGNRLRVNFAAKGSIRVTLLDESEKPLIESQPLSGDAVDQEVRWTGGLEGLSGKAVRLRFELRDAKLFAFQVASR